MIYIEIEICHKCDGTGNRIVRDRKRKKIYTRPCEKCEGKGKTLTASGPDIMKWLLKMRGPVL